MNEKPTNEQSAEESALETGSRELYRDSIDNIDAATRSRLTQARHSALQAMPKRRATTLRWLPAGAAAAAAMVAWLIIGQAPNGVPEPETVAELDILMGEDELEMLEELEFYAWIDELDELQDGLLEDGVG